MPGTVAAAADERKHMFDSALDIRRSTAHAGGMARTYVRRRRRLAAALLLVLVSALGSPVARAVAEAEAPTRAGGESDPAYVVEPGDTLWAIATRWAPGHDPREVVHLVVELNDLQTVSLVPGQRLTLPTLA
jgi:hypothetical protein